MTSNPLVYGLPVTFHFYNFALNLSTLSVVESLFLIRYLMALDLLDPSRRAIRASLSGAGLRPDETCPYSIYLQKSSMPPFFALALSLSSSPCLYILYRILPVAVTAMVWVEDGCFRQP